MNWNPIASAPRDRLLLLTDGRRVTVGKFDIYVEPETIVDLRQYRIDEMLYGRFKVPQTPMMPNPRAGKRKKVWKCCGMALLDLGEDPLSDDHHGNTIDATMWAEFDCPPQGDAT